MWKGLEHLRVLRLDDNQLRWLSEEIFKSSPLLTELDLGDNQLTEVTTGTLTTLTQLRQLSLDGNRFEVYNTAGIINLNMFIIIVIIIIITFVWPK